MEVLEELKRAIAETGAKTMAERNENFTEALLYLLEHDPMTLRRKNAAFVFGKLREPRAVLPLCRVLRRDETIVREAAADALGEIKSAEAVRPLIQALSDPTTIVRVCARRALVSLGKSAVKPLIEELWDCKPDRREGVNEALVQIGIPAVSSLLVAIECAGAGTKREAKTMLHKIAPRHALEMLPILTLKDPHLTPSERLHTLTMLLAYLRFPNVQTYCSVYRHDKTPAVAEGAKAVLSLVEGKSLLRPAAPVLQRPERELLRSLGRVQTENSAELMRPLDSPPLF